MLKFEIDPLTTRCFFQNGLKRKERAQAATEKEHKKNTAYLLQKVGCVQTQFCTTLPILTIFFILSLNIVAFVGDPRVQRRQQVYIPPVEFIILFLICTYPFYLFSQFFVPLYYMNKFSEFQNTQNNHWMEEKTKWALIPPVKRCIPTYSFFIL